MKAEITFSQVWSNPSVRRFWFREQSENTLQKLVDRAEDWDKAEELIEDYAVNNFLGLDEIEEMFYEETVESLADEFEIKLWDDEDEEDEED